MKRTYLLSCVMIGLLVAAHAVAGTPKRGRHERQFVVPKPGPVKIDGKLDDWDMSAALVNYPTEKLRATQNARFALMHGPDALYVAAEVADPTPMQNAHGPDTDPGRAWKGDSCQLRLAVDPSLGYPIRYSSLGDAPKGEGKVTHLLLWHHTDGERPALAIQTGMYAVPEPYKPDGVVPQAKYDAAYRKHEDGKGYTFEYRVPWSTLLAERPLEGGDLVAGTWQFNYGDTNGVEMMAGTPFFRDVVKGSGFPFQNTSVWGKLVFAEKGDIPRSLVEKNTAPAEPLPLTFSYELPRTGEVSIALYDEEGRMVRQLLPPEARQAGSVTERWNGLTGAGAPIEPGAYQWKAITYKPIDTDFKLSVHNSGTPPYKTADGTGGWGGDHGLPRDAIAVGKRMILSWDASENGWGIIGTDLAGDKKWGSKSNARHLATDGKRLYAAGGHTHQRKTGARVYDAEDAKPLQFEKIGKPVLRPPKGGDEKTNRVTGLLHHDGRLYASYGPRDLVAVYDVPAGTLAETRSVPDPGRLAAAENGAVLVVSGGAVRALRENAAPVVIDQRLDEPTGIAVDEAGRIYVANRGDLQNVSVFSPDFAYRASIGRKGGRPRAGEWVPGGMRAAAGLAIDPKGRLWVAEARDAPKRISVWDTKTGELVTDYFGGSHYSTYASMDPTDPTRVYCHGVEWKVNLDKGTKRPAAVVKPKNYGYLRPFTHENGRQYASSQKKGHLDLLIRDGDRFETIASVRKRTLWTDADRDGKREKEEEIELPVAFRTDGWIDDRLALYNGTRWHRVEAYRLAPTRIRDNGVPVYEPGDLQRYGPGSMKKVSVPHVMGDADSETIYVAGGPIPLHDGRYPTLNAFGFDGTRRWGYWRLHPAWKGAVGKEIPPKGTAMGVVRFLGHAGDFIAAQTYFGHVHVWTKDGIYVDRLLKAQSAGEMGPDVIACEFFTGQFVRTRDEGRYYLLAGDQDGRVNEIENLDTVEQFASGTYEVTETMAEKVREARSKWRKRKSAAESLVIGRGRGHLERADGVSAKAGPDRRFTARVSRDEEKLYVRFDVRSPHGLTNSIADPEKAFLGGNCLDIQIATNPDADPDRKEPAPGDLRLVVTRQDGEALAMLYEPQVAGREGRRVVFDSPAAREAFDRIRRLESVELAYEKKAGGFRATVSVPLEALGWNPRAGTKVRMDLGYIFGNESGSAAAKRVYWSNDGFAANVVDDLPHESRLTPAEWGNAVVE